MIFLNKGEGKITWYVKNYQQYHIRFVANCQQCNLTQEVITLGIIDKIDLGTEFKK